MDMKLRGMYIARQLSFTGVTFKIEEVLLSQSYVKMYNKAVKLVRRFFIPMDFFFSFFFFFLKLLGFELEASHLLGLVLYLLIHTPISFLL
jgi:hypothetical protein